MYRYQARCAAGMRAGARAALTRACMQDTVGPIVALYFVTLILICVQFALSLLLAAVSDAFDEEAEADPSVAAPTSAGSLISVGGAARRARLPLP
jgi:hypothetical protein